ncbi:MAG: hypothetical protein WC370_07580 [Dehalococcoidales bacterium]|jgi:hypothetical protein
MGKYDGQFIWDYKQFPPEFWERDKQSPLKGHHLLWMDGERVPGAFYMETHWFWDLTGEMPPPPDGVSASHHHDFDEIQGFFGSNMKDPWDLGAEIEFFLEGEAHTFTKSCFIFIPRGMEHLPMTIKRVWSPFMWLTGGNGKTLDWNGAPPPM